MEKIIELILSNTIYTLIAVAIIVIIVVSILKKLMKIVLYAFIIFLAFLAYVHFTGGNVQEAIDKTKTEGETIIKEGKEKIENLKEVDEIKKSIEKKLK
ncbi:MAG: hypothetical protein AAB255_03350 [Bacteroidota bacterium]